MRLRTAARKAAPVSGSRTISAMTTPTKELGAPMAATEVSMPGASVLARPTTVTSAMQSSRKAATVVPLQGRAMCVVVAPIGRKCSTMADRLHEDIDAEQQQRHEGRRMPAGMSNRRTCSRCRELGQHQRQRGQRNENGEGGALPSTRNTATWWRSAPANRQKADDAVADDHHRREYGVARQGVCPSPPNSFSETISDTSMTVTASARIRAPEGFADAVCNDFGVLDGRHDAGDQADGDDKGQYAARVHCPRRRQSRIVAAIGAATVKGATGKDV